MEMLKLTPFSIFFLQFLWCLKNSKTNLSLRFQRSSKNILCTTAVLPLFSFQKFEFRIMFLLKMETHMYLFNQGNPVAKSYKVIFNLESFIAWLCTIAIKHFLQFARRIPSMNFNAACLFFQVLFSNQHICTANFHF